MVVVEETDRATPQNNMKPETNSILLGSGSRLPAAPASSNPTTIRCPECGSQRVWKAGIRYTPYGEIQRYLCRNCAYRFSHSEGSEPFEPHQKVHRQILNCGSAIPFSRQVCVSQTKAMINLAEVETRTQEKAAGATVTDQATMKGEILQFQIYLTNQGNPKTTVRTYGDLLRGFVKNEVSIYETEAIKKHIVASDTKPNTKILQVQAYHCFLKWKKITWEKPKITREDIDPFLPQVKEVEELINGSGWLLKPFLQLVWECALRTKEANQLEWTDIDEVTRTVRIKSTKRGKPRTLTFSMACLNLLKSLPRTTTRVFGDSASGSKRTTFQRHRLRLARQTSNNRILQIHMHTLRHLRATLWYCSGVDLVTLQQRLGHRKLEDTAIYIHLSEVYSPQKEFGYYTRMTSTIRDAEQLVQEGFEFVGKDDSGCLWRKKKTFEDLLKEREVSAKPQEYLQNAFNGNPLS